MGTKEKKVWTGNFGGHFSIGSVIINAILCLHSIMAVRAVIMAKDTRKPHNIQRTVVC